MVAGSLSFRMGLPRPDPARGETITPRPSSGIRVGVLTSFEVVGMAPAGRVNRTEQGGSAARAHARTQN